MEVIRSHSVKNGQKETRETQVRGIYVNGKKVVEFKGIAASGSEQVNNQVVIDETMMTRRRYKAL